MEPSETYRQLRSHRTADQLNVQKVEIRLKGKYTVPVLKVDEYLFGFKSSFSLKESPIFHTSRTKLHNSSKEIKDP